MIHHRRGGSKHGRESDDISASAYTSAYACLNWLRLALLSSGESSRSVGGGLIGSGLRHLKLLGSGGGDCLSSRVLSTQGSEILRQGRILGAQGTEIGRQRGILAAERSDFGLERRERCLKLCEIGRQTRDGRITTRHDDGSRGETSR